jgi:hypothetical protein
VASADGFLDGWIDFNRDGDWGDAGERVFSQVALTSGANSLFLDVPQSAASGETFARFRFSSVGGLAPTGAALDGEVEDYLVVVSPGNVWQNPSNQFDVNGDGRVSSVDVLRIVQETNNHLASDPATGELLIPPVEPNTPEQVGFVDVNGDGFVTAIDALRTIRFINSQPPLQAPVQAAVSADWAAALLPGPITIDPIGDILSNPIPLPATTARATARASALAVLDDDLDDVIERLTPGEQSSQATTTDAHALDDVWADTDWLGGDLDV